MGGCEGCFTSERGQQEQYQVIRSKAVSYMNEHKLSVAIFKEGFEFFYIEASKAIEQGKVIKEILYYTVAQ